MTADDLRPVITELAKGADGKVSDHEIARGVRDGRVGIRIDLEGQG